MSFQLVTEVVVVGVITAVLYAAAERAFRALSKRPVPSWVVALFVGSAAHALFELVGANAWYCIHGAACASVAR